MEISEQDARAFVRLLWQVNGHGVVFVDPEGLITSWSRGAAHITGFEADDVIGRPFASLFVAEDRDGGMPQQELNTARAIGCAQDERWHQRKDGSRFWSSGLTYARHDDEGGVAGFIKIFRDATHLRTRMKYLENVMEDHNAEQAERNTFIGTIAHELRNPLAPIKTVLAILQLAPGVAQRHEASLKVLDRQVGFLTRLVEDLVDLTRARVGKLRVEYQRVVLQALIQEAVADMRPKAEAAGVALASVLPEQALDIEVDAGRIQQVVSNLLTNAVKFTPAGGKVWVTASADQTHFVVTVKDTGRGIPKTLLPRIFEAFTQADGASSARGEGLGIGLSVVKEIANLHRGTVEVRSEGEGKGAEFSLRVPLRQAPTSAREEVVGPAGPSA
jgi:PAS domain S-box-containing protein